MPTDAITGELIKSAVAARIKTLFPTLTNIFKEPQPGGLIHAEAFYINQIKVTDRSQLGNVWLRDYEMIVRFEPIITSSNRFERSTQVADDLMTGLQIIDLDYSKVRGRNISYAFSDDVLQVYVTYTIRIVDLAPIINGMEDLTINREVL